MKSYSSQEGITIAQIILGLLKKITDLSLLSTNINSNVSSAKTYRNSIMSLSDILLPYYDKKMKEDYKKYEKDIKENSKKNCDKKLIKNEAEYCVKIIEISRRLFRDLNQLLNRNDYLKASVYGEDASDDNVVEDEDDDDEE